MTVYVFRELPADTEQSFFFTPCQLSEPNSVHSALYSSSSLPWHIVPVSYITYLHIFHIIQGVQQKNKQTQTKKGNSHVGRKNISKGQIGKIQKRREPAGENKDYTRHRRREGVIKNQWT